MEDDQARFIAETGEEAHYWFTVSDFAALSLKYPLDHMIKDMIQLRNKSYEKEKEIQPNS
jgi:asparagine synthetase B (glutamine-hydrolysing)